MAAETGPELTNGTGVSLDEHSKSAWNWWRTTLKSPRTVLAPMVEQSELPFRVLSREYGADLCYSPMIHSRLYSERDEEHRNRMFETAPEDRPLVVQFCGNDPATLLKAAKAVEHKCDGVDLNLGCPQGIAKKGRYGAYLLEEQDVVLEIVRTLSAGLSIPLTVKIRLLPDREATIAYAKQIVRAGASALTVHGRNKEEKAQRVGTCDWAMIARIREAVPEIPIIANGGIGGPEDVEACLATTGADAVMTSEMSLVSPADVFRPGGSPRSVTVHEQVKRYLDLVAVYEPLMWMAYKPVRAHLFKMLYPGLQMHPDIRDRLGATSDISEMGRCAQELADRKWEERLLIRDPKGWLTASWYYRHRPDRLDSTLLTGDGAAAASSSDTSSSPVTPGRTLEQNRELLASAIEEAKTAAEEYKQAMELGTANKRDRNRMKKRVTKAESRKTKFLRKIASMEKGETCADGDEGEEELNPVEENTKQTLGGAEELSEVQSPTKKAKVVETPEVKSN